MSPEQEQLLIIKGQISEMPEADRVHIQECAALIRALVDASPGHGIMALAIVGLEKSL
jgi:predicted ATPase